MQVAILIPTLNAGNQWQPFIEAVNQQSLIPAKKIIIDSGSSDNTAVLAREAGFKVVSIDKKDFRHGATRQQLVELAGDCDICVFLTQDAILASADSVKNLVDIFTTDDKITLAYGRQLAHKGAKTLETHARLFNYPDRSYVRTLSDKEQYGFKTIFCSDSFAAYRTSSLKEVCGFPPDTIMGEDTIVAARMLGAGYKIAYVAEATVYHSHSYSLKEEFKRYFDTGVFHTQNETLRQTFGKADGEGFRFVKSELSYVLKNELSLLLSLPFTTMAKWFGYKLGTKYKLLGKSAVKAMSMHKSYWTRENNF